MKKIKISTDSTADIPVDVREKYDISVLPLTIIADGKEYKDSYDITPIEFYNLMEECKDTPTSSQVATSVYTEFFEKCLKDGYTDIIHTTLNSKGSGTYQAAVLSRDLFYEENPDAESKLKIHIIDSKLYTMAYGWAVVDAAQKVQNGENDVEKNIFIVEGSSYPDVEKGNLMIAGHSGTGWKAFFNDLYKLNVGDTAYVKYKNKKYIYNIVNIYTQPKYSPQ